MASALENQVELKNSQELEFEDRLGILVDAQLAAQDSKQLTTRLQAANLRLSACLEDLDVKAARGLDRAVITSLATSVWLQRTRNVIIEGPTGVGKTWLACALAQHACRQGFPALYQRVPRLTEALRIAHADGTFTRKLQSIAKVDLLILDDWGLHPLNQEERSDLLEIMDDRVGTKSTIITSQLPVEHWHEYLDDPTLADAILDRIVHQSHKIKLKGESMRKQEVESPAEKNKKPKAS